MGHIGAAVVADGGGSEDGGDRWTESPTGIADKGDSEEECWTVGELSGGHVAGVSGEVLQVEAGLKQARSDVTAGGLLSAVCLGLGSEKPGVVIFAVESGLIIGWKGSRI